MSVCGIHTLYPALLGTSNSSRVLPAWLVCVWDRALLCGQVEVRPVALGVDPSSSSSSSGPGR